MYPIDGCPSFKREINAKSTFVGSNLRWRLFREMTMKSYLVIALLCIARSAYADRMALDLSGVKPGSITVTSSGDSLEVSLDDAGSHHWKTTFSLVENTPLIA